MGVAEYEELEPLIVATIRHTGPHDPRFTDSTWGDLIIYSSPRRLLGRRFDIRGIGLLWDDPRVFADDERRYDVGIPIDAEDSMEVERPAFVTVTLPGRYLKARHVGPYDAILTTYEEALVNTMRFEGVELAAAPMIELYRNSPADVPEDELITDIYFPVVKF